MGLETEAFYIDGRPSGALVRRSGDGVLSTTLAFLLPEGDLVHRSQETRFAATVLDWSSYRYTDHRAGSDITGSPADYRQGAGPRPIPSYAAYPLLVQWLRAGRNRLAFRQFVEDGDGAVCAAAFTRWGWETIDTPGGRQEALKVVLEVEGAPGNTFWWNGQAVVKSDWQGAASYAASDLSLFLEGLDPRVRSALEATLDPPPRR
ncbi:hypothetical protein ACX80W_03710 [Arthrobacter sp. TMN-37]